jgi:hypothetical protein
LGNELLAFWVLKGEARGDKEQGLLLVDGSKDVAEIVDFF